MSPPQIRGFQKYGAHFSEEKKHLRQCTHKLGAWYQDLGTKIYREPERRSLSLCRGGCRPPATESGELETPQDLRGVWGAAAPQ